jgi:WD40 repeat protein
MLSNVDNGAPLHTLGYADPSSSLAFSPDGTLLASYHTETIDVWKVATGDKVLSLTNETLDYVELVAFSPDGKLVASKSTGGSSYPPNPIIKLWEIATGNVVRTFSVPDGSVIAIAFSADGKLLSSLYEERFPSRFLTWQVSSGASALFLPNVTQWIGSLPFSSDGRFLATVEKCPSSNEPSFANPFSQIHLVEIATGREVRALPSHMGSCLDSVAFAKEGTMIVSVADLGNGLDKEFRLWYVGDLAGK